VNAAVSAELYAHFGRALHEAQILEFTVQGFAVQLEVPKGGDAEASEETWARIEHLFRRTIGYVQERFDIPSEVADDLEQARQARNYLAHEFFLQPQLQAGDAEVERQTIEGLDRLRDDFLDLAKRLDELTWKVLGEKPPTDEEIEDLLADLPPQSEDPE